MKVSFNNENNLTQTTQTWINITGLKCDKYKEVAGNNDDIRNGGLGPTSVERIPPHSCHSWFKTMKTLL